MPRNFANLVREIHRSNSTPRRRLYPVRETKSIHIADKSRTKKKVFRIRTGGVPVGIKIGNSIARQIAQHLYTNTLHKSSALITVRRIKGRSHSNAPQWSACERGDGVFSLSLALCVSDSSTGSDWTLLWTILDSTSKVEMVESIFGALTILRYEYYNHSVTKVLIFPDILSRSFSVTRKPQLYILDTFICWFEQIPWFTKQTAWWQFQLLSDTMPTGDSLVHSWLFDLRAIIFSGLHQYSVTSCNHYSRLFLKSSCTNFHESQ